MLRITLESFSIVSDCCFKITLLPVAEATVVIEITVTGHKSNSPRKIFDGFVKIRCSIATYASVIVRVRIVRVELQRCCVVLDRFIKLPQLIPCKPPVEVRLEMGRICTYGFRVLLDGTLEIVVLSQGKPTSVVLISFNKSCRAVGHICIGIAIICCISIFARRFCRFLFPQSTVNSFASAAAAAAAAAARFGSIAAACRRLT